MRSKADTTYPLLAVVRQRTLERDEKARRVARMESRVRQKEGQLGQAREDVRRREEEIEEFSEKRARVLASDVRGFQVRMMLDREASLKKGLDQALKRCDDARRRLEGSRSKLEVARKDLAGALGRLKAVQRHRDEWEREQRRGAEKHREEDP